MYFISIIILFILYIKHNVLYMGNHFLFEKSLCTDTACVLYIKSSSWIELWVAPSVKWRWWCPPYRILVSSETLSTGHLVGKAWCGVSAHRMSYDTHELWSSISFSLKPQTLMHSGIKPLAQGLKSGRSNSRFLLASDTMFCHSWKTRCVGHLKKHDGCQPWAERWCPSFVDCHPFSKHFCHSQLKRAFFLLCQTNIQVLLLLLSRFSHVRLCATP